MKKQFGLGLLILLLSACTLPERSPEAKEAVPFHQQTAPPPHQEVSPPAPPPVAGPAVETLPPVVVAPPVQPTPVPVVTPQAPPPKGVTRYIPRDTFRGLDFGATLQKIGFGSCANQDQPEPIWTVIEKDKPDLFLFMGDNIYADKPGQQPIAEQYRKLDQIPEYRSFRMKVPFLAIWDDGDLGTNNGGANAPTREEAKTAFLNYWTYAKNSLPLDQIKRGGLYHSKIIGPKNKMVQIIMLDTRYYRSPLHKKGEDMKGYEPGNGPRDVLLGEDQWRWLESQLRRPANLRLIVSSIQLVADGHHFEKWGNFPREKQRFFNLLRKTGAHNVVVLSGDRHLGAISKTDVKGWGSLYDITSSSLNRPKGLQEEDPAYVGPILNRENFGMAYIDWNHRTVKFELRNLENKVENSVEIKLRK